MAVYTVLRGCSLSPESVSYLVDDSPSFERIVARHVYSSSTGIAAVT